MTDPGKLAKRPSVVPRVGAASRAGENLPPFRPPDTRRIGERPIEIDVGMADYLELLALALGPQAAMEKVHLLPYDSCTTAFRPKPSERGRPGHG